jgi:hypothetical protein
MRASFLVATALASSAAALAAPVTYFGSSGALSASAEFELVGSTLHVTLQNTSDADVLQPSQVLTGMFFSIAGNPSLTPLSATTLGATSLGGVPVSGAGAAVGGEWAYLNGLSQYGANSGISSSGLGIFGAANVFPPGTNLSGPVAPNGLQYGLASAGDNTATGNAAILGTELTKYGVEFLFSGFDLPLSSITGIHFQYGAALTDANFAAAANVPEPGSLALMAVALAAVGIRRRPRRR